MTETLEVLVPPRSAPLVGWVLVLVGLALMGSGVYDVAGSLSAGDVTGALLRGGFPLVFGALLLVVGNMVRARKGGISIDRTARALIVHGRSDNDRLLVPFDDLARLRLTFRDLGGEAEAVRQWAAELELKSGAALLLGEGANREGVLVFARGLMDSLPCPIDETPERAGAFTATIPPAPLPPGVSAAQEAGGTRYTYAVTGSWGLSAVLPLLGASSLAVGATMMAFVTEAPISGFLFGPVLAILGLALLGVSLAKMAATEELVLLPDQVSHSFRMFGRSFARRELARRPGTGIYARLRPRGAQGTCLEVVGAESSLFVAAGVTATTHGLDLAGLLAFAATIGFELRSE